MNFTCQSTQACNHSAMRIERDALIAEAVSVLRAGGSVVHATETCYGIACDLSNPAAVERLFRIKRRPFAQPVSALFASLEQARQYLAFSEIADTLAKEHLPGPLTIVLPQHKDAARLYVVPNLQSSAPHFSVGLRISPHTVALALVRAFGKPIATTSANLHGKPNPYSIEDILSQFSGAEPVPDLILDSGTLSVAPPSTVAEVIGEDIRILRQGEVRLDGGEEDEEL